MRLMRRLKDIGLYDFSAKAMLLAAILTLPLSARACGQASTAPRLAGLSFVPQAAASGVPPKLTPHEEREAQIASEAQKLYELAVDLKIEMDKSNKDTMSLSVVKKAAEIEKLARTLQQHMKAE